MYLSLKATSPPCSVTLSIRTGTAASSAFAAFAPPEGASSRPAPFSTIPCRFSVPSALTMTLE